MKHLVILSSTDTDPDDARMSLFAELMGIRPEVFRVQHELDPRGMANRVGSATCSVALNAVTLRYLYVALPPGATLWQFLGEQVQEILIYGLSVPEDIDEALLMESHGAVARSDERIPSPCSCSFPEDARELSIQLARQTFPVRNADTIASFEIRTKSNTETIMAANGQPVFVRCRVGGRWLFLSAAPILDMNKAVTHVDGLRDEYLSLLPPLIFLRHCFPEGCWHNTEPAGRLIIDDPLLRKKYGALDFRDLTESMRRLGYGTSIAFIPWNYRRTSRRAADQLLGRGSDLSICIHGCDHTNREFSSGAPQLLAAKADLSMRRMDAHRRRVGRPFEDVMVFPQGRFSKASLPALRSANFLAAVNSTCFPTDSAPGDIKVADLLWPAVNLFDGFPVFPRRYPKDAFGSAIDLFLGKPALLVEHHEYFRDHCRAIEDFIARLQQIEPRLLWPNLTTLLTQSHVRRSFDHTTDIRFFTRRFQLVPREGDASHYRLSKLEPDPKAVARVIVEGKSIPFGFENGFISLEIETEPRETKQVEICYVAEPSRAIRSFGAAYQSRVLVRRTLSEFRDNTLSHHKGLLKVAKKLAKAMKATAES